MGCDVNSHKGADNHRAKEPYIFIHKLVIFHLLFTMRKTYGQEIVNQEKQFAEKLLQNLIKTCNQLRVNNPLPNTRPPITRRNRGPPKSIFYLAVFQKEKSIIVDKSRSARRYANPFSGASGQINFHFASFNFILTGSL